ncbi:MAG: LptF/LptG family permease, partial [Ignavibacteria bacterium]|nr:LptF/LptG family permease [Ignavibacteria bacterium]
MIIYKYILKKLVAPFLFSSLTLFFILLLQFLMKTADQLIGRGLSSWVIIKLIIYNLSWMVVLIIPMAVLVTVLMTFGNLTQENEFTILKSSGVSLLRLMTPVLIISIILCILLIEFNNKVLPDANYKNKNLMFDISRTKPTLKLEANVFSTEVSNYCILAREISKNTNELFDLVIYDYSIPSALTIITAKKGNILFSRDNKKLLFYLYDGEIHQNSDSRQRSYRKIDFVNHKIALEAEQFTFEQTGPGAPRGDRELSAQAMRIIVDSIQVICDSLKKMVNNLVNSYNNEILIDSSTVNNSTNSNSEITLKDGLTLAVNDIKSKYTNLSGLINRLIFYDAEVDKYLVEIYKKYAIPFACIVFVLIGAPLGVITRKGNFGVAAGISLFFFLIYWACLIGCLLYTS